MNIQHAAQFCKELELKISALVREHLKGVLKPTGEKIDQSPSSFLSSLCWEWNALDPFGELVNHH